MRLREVADTPIDGSNMTHFEGRPRIGSYELISRMGCTGPAARHAVYRARTVETGWPACVKVSRTDPTATEGQRDSFARKATVLLDLEHLHLVRVVGSGWETGFHYLAMNYVKGDSLDRIVRDQGPLPEGPLLHLGLHLVSALGYLHSVGLVHCSISPDHVLVRGDGVAKLADFLGVRMMGRAASSLSCTRTAAREPCPYTAPEMLSPLLPLDHRADYYGLGATLYFAGTGNAPFNEEKDSENLSRLIRNRRLRSPRRKNRNLSTGLADLLLSLTEKTPGRRPSSLADIRARLTSLMKPSPARFAARLSRCT